MIPLARLRQLTGVSPGDERDARLQLELDGAFEALEASTRLWRRREAYVQTRRPRPQVRHLWFSLYPIESITLVGWNYGDDPDAAAEISATDYHVTPEAGQVTRTRLPYWPDFVRATITGGYTTLPRDAELALVRQIEYSLSRNDPTRIAQRAVAMANAGGSTTFRDEALHPEFEAFIARHARVVFT